MMEKLENYAITDEEVFVEEPEVGDDESAKGRLEIEGSEGVEGRPETEGSRELGREEYQMLGESALEATRADLAALTEMERMPGNELAVESASVIERANEGEVSGESVMNWELDTNDPGEATNELVKTAAVEQVEEMMKGDRELARRMQEMSSEILKMAEQGNEAVREDAPVAVEEKAEVVQNELGNEAGMEQEGNKNEFEAYIERVLKGE